MNPFFAWILWVLSLMGGIEVPADPDDAQPVSSIASEAGSFGHETAVENPGISNGL